MDFIDNGRAYLALAFGVVAVGFSGIFVSWANAPGAITGFYRMVVGAIALTPLVGWHWWHNKGRFSPRATPIALLAGFFFAGDMIFWNTGILISGPTNPTLMGNTAPIWVGIGSMFFFRQRLPRGFWGGVALALVGAAVILGLDAVQDVGLGTFFGLLAGVFYGAYFLVIQRSREDLDSVRTLWLVAISSSLWLALASLLLDQPFTGYTTQTYWHMIGLGLVVQVLGQLSITYALGHLPATIVSPTLLGQPVITALLSIPLLGDTITTGQIAGGLTVLTGLYIVNRSQLKTAEPQPT